MSFLPQVSIAEYRPLNRWMDWDDCQPGKVGSIGDPLTAVRLKQSAIDLPPRYDALNPLGVSQRLGTYVQDGTQGGAPARAFGGEFSNPDPWSPRGFTVTNVIPSDRVVDPVFLGVNQLTWKNNVAQTFDAIVGGNKFAPAPGSFQLAPGELPRGNGPRETTLDSTESSDLMTNLVNTLSAKNPKPEDPNRPRGFNMDNRSFGYMRRK